MFTEMRMVRPHPGPLPQERERDECTQNHYVFRRDCFATERGEKLDYSSSCNRAPSPGGEGRGEGGSFLQNLPKPTVNLQ